MFKIKNLEIVTIAFISSTLISCFGSDNTSIDMHTDFTSKDVTQTPNTDLQGDVYSNITQDTNIPETILTPIN